MKIKYILLFILPLLLVLGSCKKFDAGEQANIDDSTILKFISDKNIVAQKHSSGIYYQILSSGSGNISFTNNTTVSTKYTGRLLSGTVFDGTTTQPISFKLGQVISGWQIGIPLIQKGGKILSSGSGNISFTNNTTVSTKYTGRLLNGTVFDGTTTQPISFKLGQVISGWQIGIPLIQKGGKIRLLIPSGLAYGPDGQGPIPGNAVLDFDIELLDVTN